MSNLNRSAVIAIKAYVEPFIRREDGFTLMAPFHPSHPMRMMDTIRVGSMREMWELAPLGIDISSQNEGNGALTYALASVNLPKPVLIIRAEEMGGHVYKIAATTIVPEDLALVEGALDVAKGLVWRRVDASEALFWFVLFASASPLLVPPNPVRSFRELFALARAFLARMAPYFEFMAMMRPIAYGAALLENAAGVAQNSNYTEPQVASGPMQLIPVAVDNITLPFEPVVVYPRSLISLCKRYIYETEFVERVVDEATDRNVRRITCERYLAPIVPAIFYYNYENVFAIPSVVMRADDAIQEISSTYGPNVLSNLTYATTVN